MTINSKEGTESMLKENIYKENKPRCLCSQMKNKSKPIPRKCHSFSIEATSSKQFPSLRVPQLCFARFVYLYLADFCITFLPQGSHERLIYSLHQTFTL